MVLYTDVSVSILNPDTLPDLAKLVLKKSFSNVLANFTVLVYSLEGVCTHVSETKYENDDNLHLRN